MFMAENDTVKNKITNFLYRHRALLLILAGSFFICLVYSFYFQITPVVDARAYDTIAQNIVAANGYREDLQTDLAHDFAIARVGPLYEYFLAGLYEVFGHRYGPVWLAQALLHALSAWLIYLTTLLIFPGQDRKKKIALWAAAIFAFYPDLIEISAMLLTETLYLFFVCLLLYLFFSFRLKNNFWLASFLGLAAGLATLARPPVLFLVPVALFYFWQKKLWRPAMLFLLVMFLVLVPWTVRNYQVYGEIMPFGAAGNYNFWIGNWHGSDGEQSPQPFHSAFTATHDIKEVNGESLRQFKNFILSHPAEFIKLTLLRINKYFSIIRPMGFWFYQTGLGQLLFILSSAAASVFLFIFSLAGAIKAVVTKDKNLYYLLALAIFTPLIIFVTVVETRYRFQIYPLLAILSAYSLAGLFEEKRWWRDRILLISTAVIFGNGLVDLLFSSGRLVQRLGNFFK